MALIPMSKTGGAIETGTVTVKTGTGGTADRLECYKRDGLVKAHGRLYNMSTNNMAAGQYFTVPTGFRPIQNTSCTCSIIAPSISNSIIFVCYGSVNTDGSVTISYSGSVAIQSVEFDAMYFV